MVFKEATVHPDPAPSQKDASDERSSAVAASTGESPETGQDVAEPKGRVRGSMVERFTEHELVVEVAQPWTARFVIRADGRLGSIWSVISTSLILYIATVFPYKLCFLDFSPSKPDDAVEPIGWFVIETALSWLFIVDLVINFFVSYYDKDGNEILDLKLIAVKYVCTVMFWVNFLACIPESLATILFGALMGGGGAGSGANRALLILRLQRITRLARMLRLAKLARLMQLSFVRKLAKLRGPRMIGLAVALFWSMHLLGCGWFLVAVLHSDETKPKTWIYARGIEEAGPLDQWITSMYWVLTVFTTVGFGDISPGTVGEILYGSLVMIIGTVLNTVFLSEIINLMNLDRRAIETEQAIATIQDFAQHTRLEEKTQFELEAFARQKNAKSSAGVDGEHMQKLLNGAFLPKEKITELADLVFDSRFRRNTFFKEVTEGVYTHPVVVPDRFVLFLASSAMEREFGQFETVYKVNEMASAVYLVLKGTFSFVHQQLPMRTSPNETTEDYLSPYQLMSHNTYFGASELLNEVEYRIAETRCDSKQGCALCISKKAFFAVCADNSPGFIKAMVRLSWVHEFSRRRRKREWSVFLPYKLLAALTILRAWRSYKEKFSRARTPFKTDEYALEVAKEFKGKNEGNASILRMLAELSQASKESTLNLQLLQKQVDAVLDYQREVMGRPITTDEPPSHSRSKCLE
eukprot:TRINITY_DN106690_c0_g1_i1.p1 TRINITY_DN106690_c0_g1~~TRINITY_DN106690_c0_g1_i1.p1  ORF type:complete len:695 (-),score=103.12 TRINITY_DN106690_c0_g1_i1:23-2107(-)